MTTLQYRDCDCAIILFDMNQKSSFEDIKNHWMPYVVEYGPKNVMIVMIGTKSDVYKTTIENARTK